MAVARCKSVTVADLDHVSVATFAARDRYLAGCRRAHGLAHITAQIDAGVNRRAPQERIHAHAERRAHVGVANYRLAHGNRDQCLAIAVNLRPRDMDAIELTFEGAGA